MICLLFEIKNLSEIAALPEPMLCLPLRISSAEDQLVRSLHWITQNEMAMRICAKSEPSQPIWCMNIGRMMGSTCIPEVIHRLLVQLGWLRALWPTISG